MGDNYSNSEAPFNMAVATLMRLDTILQQIRTLDYQSPFDSAGKQKSYLGLVKQFYINSIPLLKEEDAKKFRYLLKLNIPSKTKIKSGVQKVNSYYNCNLDLKLNEALIEIQQLLRKYFMPKGKDLKHAFANLG